MVRLLLLLVCSFATAVAYADEAVFYESRAKLLVRHVVEQSPADGAESTTVLNAGPTRSEAIMSAELEIINSHDLALEVTEAVGHNRLAAGAGLLKAAHTDAIQAFREGLRIAVPKGSTILSLSFRSRDSGLPKLVLEEVIRCYFEKRFALHRSDGVLGVSAEGVDLIRARLKETDGSLRILEGQLGAGAKEDAAALATQIENVREERQKLKAELAEREKKGGQARMNGALELSKIPSISVIEKPSKPVAISR